MRSSGGEQAVKIAKSFRAKRSLLSAPKIRILAASPAILSVPILSVVALLYE
jgi:hypothetical protein